MDEKEFFSEYHLGLYYIYGNGVTKSASKAIYWLKKAALNGYAPARKIIEELLPQKEVQYCEFCGNKLPSLSEVCPVCKKLVTEEE